MLQGQYGHEQAQKTIEEERSIQNIPPERLNKILCEFFMTTERNGSSEFEPGTLFSFQNSF